jgi:predicted amidohydrolase YtcJ
MLNPQRQAGSIEVGKSADFIGLDRDILALGDAGHPEEIAGKHVLETWFQGKKSTRRQRRRVDGLRPRLSSRCLL